RFRPTGAPAPAAWSVSPASWTGCPRGSPAVARRAEGRLHLLPGQHRVAALHPREPRVQTRLPRPVRPPGSHDS
ncbi:unnamed protein product, partial [Tetraodon nigroviridis]